LVKTPIKRNAEVNLNDEPLIELADKCTNLNYIKKIAKSDDKLLAEMIRLYLDDIPKLVMAMNQSFSIKNWESLYQTVHKMIPSFHLMGISSDFEDMAKRVQDFANSPSSDLGIAEMIIKLESVCNQACDELRVDLLEIEK
jgi:hypothetical protein